jgi:hypothetical protein
LRARCYRDEKTSIEHPYQRYKKESDRKDHWSAFVDCSAQQNENREEHAAEEHQFRRATNVFASTRGLGKLRLIRLSDRQGATRQPLRQSG